MKNLYLFSLFLFAFGQVCLSGAEFDKYGDTSWSISQIQSDWISIKNKGVIPSGYTLYISHGMSHAGAKPWHVALRTDHFLVNNEYESLGVKVSFNAKKPFTLTNRSTVEFLHCSEEEDSLFFLGSQEAVVNWIISKELIEVSIEEMGGTFKKFTFDTHGLKEVMLEAQRRQRALK